MATVDGTIFRHRPDTARRRVCDKIVRPMESVQPAGPALDPGPILQTAFGFWSSKVLLTAVSLDVFTKLGSRRLTGAELGAETGLHPRGISDFFDALVAMKFLERNGDGPSAKYLNTPAGELY